MALVITGLGIAPALAAGLGSASSLMTLIICLPVAVAFVLLALWFPTMRYELRNAELILRCGPLLTYRIPLGEIRSIRRRTLGLTIWSCVRFPGVALFTAPYADVGNVKMCATAALNDILLIETPKCKYGITPADEAGLVAALRLQMEA
jgi:hypothetical protein